MESAVQYNVEFLSNGSGEVSQRDAKSVMKSLQTVTKDQRSCDAANFGAILNDEIDNAVQWNEELRRLFYSYCLDYKLNFSSKHVA